MIVTIVLIGVLVIGITLFINLNPQFGGTISNDKKEVYAKSKNYEKGKFILRAPVMTGDSFWSVIKKSFKSIPNAKPQTNLESQQLDSLDIVNYQNNDSRLTWFGHSTFLLEMDGKNILLDPMLGEHASPIPISMAKRFSETLPIQIEKLPFIDFVVYSHDHYDHLDYGSVQKLKDKVGMFYVPLGLSAHLVKWGVAAEKIKELDWWQTAQFDHIQLVCTPANHFSGRGLFDRGTTLWASWVIKGANENIYFSGDGGYGDHFKQIGDQYGPFDIAMMECGQYDENWSKIHMFPEETVQASVDIQAKLMIPIHWGGFKLANHSWTDPIERVLTKANELNVQVSTPQIGEPILLNEDFYPQTKWWESYE